MKQLEIEFKIKQEGLCLHCHKLPVFAGLNYCLKCLLFVFPPDFTHARVDGGSVDDDDDSNDNGDVFPHYGNYRQGDHR